MTVPDEYQVHTSCSTGCKLEPMTHCKVLGYDKCSKLVMADEIFSESILMKYLKVMPAKKAAREKRAIKDLYGSDSKRQELRDAIEASNEGAVNAQSTNLSRQQAARLQQGKEEPDE